MSVNFVELPSHRLFVDPIHSRERANDSTKLNIKYKNDNIIPNIAALMSFFAWGNSAKTMKTHTVGENTILASLVMDALNIQQ